MLFINIAAGMPHKCILNYNLAEFIGIALLSQLSPMIQDIFGKSPTDAAVVVSVCSGWNAVGRLFWATVSDNLGRKHTFALFFSIQGLIFGIFPTLADNGQYLPFVFGLCIILSMYGGGFATIPAFLADLFGHKNVGAVHGVILTR